MFRPQLMAWLLLAAAAPGGDCRIASGPDGLCAGVRLDPSRLALQVGSSLRVRVNGLDCVVGRTCVDCANRRRRVDWRSSAPDVATVDSTGLIRAEHPGAADIRLEADEAPMERLASMRVVVSP